LQNIEKQIRANKEQQKLFEEEIVLENNNNNNNDNSNNKNNNNNDNSNHNNNNNNGNHNNNDNNNNNDHSEIDNFSTQEEQLEKFPHLKTLMQQIKVEIYDFTDFMSNIRGVALDFLEAAAIKLLPIVSFLLNDEIWESQKEYIEEDKRGKHFHSTCFHLRDLIVKLKERKRREKETSK